MKPRNSTIAIFVALLFFATANLFSYLRMPQYSTIDDGFVYFGWPFTVYLYGGFWSHAVIAWTGVLGNVVVALGAGRVLGWTLDALSRPPRNGGTKVAGETEGNQT